MITIQQFSSPPMANNSYVIHFDDSSCYVVDPSFSTKALIAYIEKKSLKVKAILLTHGHIDHIVGIPEVLKQYPCEVYLGTADHDYLVDGELSGADQLKPGFTLSIQPLDWSHFKNLLIEVIDTPGHTPGGVALYLPTIQTMISGDTLFYEALGRTDLPGGSSRDLQQSLKYLLSYPPATKVLPGHDRSTTIEHERVIHRYQKK